jgi:hypothetical protein
LGVAAVKGGYIFKRFGMIQNSSVIYALGQVLSGMGFFPWMGGAITAAMIIGVFSLIVGWVKGED